MPKFSVEKLQEIRRSKNLTYDEIVKLSGLSKSTISKVFGGFQENPTTLFLEKMAEIFDCGIDDFFVYEKIPKSPYYLDRKSTEIASLIAENGKLALLYSAASKLNSDDIDLITNLIKRINGVHPY